MGLRSHYSKDKGNYRAGRKSASPRIDRLLEANQTSLRMVERNTPLSALDQKNGIFSVNALKVSGANISEVLQGKRNTPRLVKALEKALGYPIDFLRQVYREDVERAKSGNPVSYDEALNWWYDLKGINVKEKLAQLGMGIAG